MNNKIKRLELENTLSQIYSNDYVYEGPFLSFSFTEVLFVTLNFIDIYTKEITFTFQRDQLCLQSKDFTIEVKYFHIDILLINFRERTNVW